MSAAGTHPTEAFLTKRLFPRAFLRRSFNHSRIRPMRSGQPKGVLHDTSNNSSSKLGGRIHPSG